MMTKALWRPAIKSSPVLRNRTTAATFRLRLLPHLSLPCSPAHLPRPRRHPRRLPLRKNRGCLRACWQCSAASSKQKRKKIPRRNNVAAEAVPVRPAAVTMPIAPAGITVVDEIAAVEAVAAVTSAVKNAAPKPKNRRIPALAASNGAADADAVAVGTNSHAMALVPAQRDLLNKKIGRAHV